MGSNPKKKMYPLNLDNAQLLELVTTCQDARSKKQVLQAGDIISYCDPIAMAGKELDSMHPKDASLDIDLRKIPDQLRLVLMVQLSILIDKQLVSVDMTFVRKEIMGQRGHSHLVW